MARKQGKQYQAARKLVEAKEYQLEEAVPLIKKVKFAKFDETVEVHMRLGVDPKHADQMVRGGIPVSRHQVATPSVRAPNRVEDEEGDRTTSAHSRPGR